ncbi:hypothetical protein GCM10010230_24540 [Streptomyces narbonensis]|uniref:serine hydrolase domain-containing protein n=1 Tax=Streptomyces narbonensis TaxID=67333 RepID=UPI0019C4E30D|nr:serine hydrolase domain-containing protein [Streptomyces narbonensis]GGV99139.1 hypothetical protein GCM10010230_24540 [Streptomyces narbonensis]
MPLQRSGTTGRAQAQPPPPEALARRPCLSAALALSVVAPAQAAPDGLTPVLDRAALRAAIEPRPGDSAAGVVAEAHRNGETWRGAAGDVVTGRHVSPRAHFRIGSVTKTMEAVILLQLSAEDRVDLDDSVQLYLPGLLPEDRFKEPISVRQLLDHTSGLPHDLEGAPASTPDEEIEQRMDYVTFDEVIRKTLRPEGRPGPGPCFSPGTRQEYNSFGYRIAGKLIEEITGHSYQYEAVTRILRPLRMRDTRPTVPNRATPVPRPYLPGYLAGNGGDLVDVNVQGGLPASMTATTADLDRFISGLFDGPLLRPAQAAELFTVPKGEDGKPSAVHGRLPLQHGAWQGHSLLQRGVDVHAAA